MLTNEQAEGLLAGLAEVLWITQAERITPIVRNLGSDGVVKPPSRTPLLAIRVRNSESRDFYNGQIFHTISDFDAKIRSVRAATGGNDSVALMVILDWKNGDCPFYGRFDLFRDREEYLVEYVHRVCNEVLNHRRLSAFAETARLTAIRIFAAAVAERLSRVAPSRALLMIDTAAPAGAFPHDYRLEPTDELIQELQSSVVQYRLQGALARADLIEDMFRAVREIVTAGAAADGVGVAAMALLSHCPTVAAITATTSPSGPPSRAGRR